MKIFTQEITLPSYLCDRNDRLFMWAAMRLFQEAAENHSIATGYGYEDMLQKNLIWIITRAYYIIHRLPKFGEKIMLSTWARGHDGLFAIRDYEMTSAEGQTLMAGTAYWPLMDYAAHKPLRLNGMLDNYTFNPHAATDRTTLNRLRLPDMSNADNQMDQPRALRNDRPRTACEQCRIRQADFRQPDAGRFQY